MAKGRQRLLSCLLVSVAALGRRRCAREHRGPEKIAKKAPKRCSHLTGRCAQGHSQPRSRIPCTGGHWRVARRQPEFVMTEHPRFLPSKTRPDPDLAHRDYNGATLVDFVFWLVDRWRARKSRHPQPGASPAEPKVRFARRAFLFRESPHREPRALVRMPARMSGSMHERARHTLAALRWD